MQDLNNQRRLKMDVKRGLQAMVHENLGKELYKCCACGHEFDEDDVVVHFANAIHSADMDACPKCDSEDIEEGV